MIKLINHYKIVQYIILLVVSLFVIISCTSAPITQEFYVLNSQTTPIINISGNPVASIRSVSLPSYLENKGIATLTNSRKVKISLTDIWAEELEKSIPLLLAKQIENKIKEPVILHPIPIGHKVKTILEIDIYKLISDGNNLFLEAKYKIIKENSLITKNFSTIIKLENKTPLFIINAHEQSLIKLADAISKQI